MALEFFRRGKHVKIDSFNPQTMLLDYLRLEEKSKGTKEGCNEGDCGACTVVLGRAKNGKMHYQAVNACILFLGQIHGCELITVDDLKVGGKLHPIQQAMVKHHASQCGFCTPGFVMSLFALAHQHQTVSREEVITQIAGNLCRCTGYKPIIDAGLEACNNCQDQWHSQEAATVETLSSIATSDLFVGNDQSFFAAPASVQALVKLVVEKPEARVVSGATDVGLWVTKQFRDFPQIIYTGRADGFASIDKTSKHLSIGAGATYAESLKALAELAPDIGQVMQRLGSAQVRSSGTIGGNIANGSPIGDMPPMLIALGAALELRHGETSRRMPLENFFIDYGKQDRKAGELVWRVEIPKLQANQHFKAYKISKRFDQDISAVLGAFLFTMDKDLIQDARIAFGGMAATPKRASKTEKILRGLTLAEALQIKLDEYQPISDMRASALYRMETAQALLTKALMELQGKTQTRVLAS
jgi:xanthine dehydrogenase small subunit